MYPQAFVRKRYNIFRLWAFFVAILSESLIYLALGETCLEVENSGCHLDLDFFPTDLGDLPCRDVRIIPPNGVFLCQSEQSEALDTCKAEYAIYFGGDADNCTRFMDACCTTPTASPTASPSLAPSASPTSFPTFDPTPSPSQKPSPSPIPQPTLTPTNHPTQAPSPPTVVQGFFATTENIYYVAGSGVGVLIIAVVGLILVRRLSAEKDVPPTREESVPVAALRGGSKSPSRKERQESKKSFSPSFKVKVSKVVEDSIFDWEKHVDKDSGDVYFFNPKTGESRWDAPEILEETIKNLDV